MNIEQEYTELIKQCEQLDYSNIDTIFEYANNKLSKHSWELALVIMVNIFIKHPDLLLDELSEHILLVIEYEGSRTTYGYMRQKYYENKDISIKKNIELLMRLLESKYAKMGIFLKKQRNVLPCWCELVARGNVSDVLLKSQQSTNQYNTK